MVFGIYIHKLLEPDVDIELYGQVFEAMINGTFSIPLKGRRKTA
jgi:hypothetical protein